MRYIKIEEYINGAHENFVTEIEISTLILVITICSCTGIIVNKLNEINKK